MYQYQWGMAVSASINNDVAKISVCGVVANGNKRSCGISNGSNNGRKCNDVISILKASVIIICGGSRIMWHQWNLCNGESNDVISVIYNGHQYESQQWQYCNQLSSLMCESQYNASIMANGGNGVCVWLQWPKGSYYLCICNEEKPAIGSNRRRQYQWRKINDISVMSEAVISSSMWRMWKIIKRGISQPMSKKYISQWPRINVCGISIVINGKGSRRQ